MNTPQANRLLMIAERARKFNNYADCDVIEEAIQQLESANNQKEALQAIEYVLVSVDFRRGTVAGDAGEQACDDIKLLKHEFKAYTSMLTAQNYQMKTAIEYFDREMESGRQTRII